MNAEVGSTFGRYRLLRLIATDAVTQTFFATPDGAAPRSRSGGGGQFAVRIARPLDERDEHAVELAQRFLSRAQHAGVVDHPAIVRPSDLGIVNSRPFVVTPFVRAVPLGDLLQHGGAINEAAALAMFAQLAGALDVAHRAGVVHGALSPRTIWVGPSAGEGAAYVGYLTGFEISPLLADHLLAEPRGAVLDDVLYVAPEQLRAEPATAPSDQYALACGLFHTLTGQPPFVRASRSKLYGAHLLTPPPSLHDLDPAISPATSDALRRAMNKQPAERFPSCGLLIHEALPNDANAAALTAAPRRTLPRRARVVDRRSRARWPLALAVLAVLVAVLTLWVVAGQGRQSEAAGPVDQPLAAQARPPPVTVTTPAVGRSNATTVWSTRLAGQRIRRLNVVDGAVAAETAAGVVVLEAADGAVRSRQPLADATTFAAAGQTAAPEWLAQVDDPWPTVLTLSDAVVLATKDGDVCQHAVADGVLHWCEPVPGVAVEQPRLLVSEGSVVAATSQAIVALVQATGATSWSASPGSPRNVVAAGPAGIAFADPDAVRLLDPATGDVVLQSPDLSEVTALAVTDASLFVGTADGTVHNVHATPGG